MRPLMVLGCTSTAGKSLLVTALCRWFARRGVDVAPFKAQNMSNNARVVEGGEIGVAQWLQALAAGIEPTVDMNPVLVKPQSDMSGQVVVDGVVRPAISAVPWRERAPHLWPAMTGAYERLAGAHDLVILEGAGSPAEINLADLTNCRMLAHADAVALLVVDIDRGGAFAHLVGTWSLVPETVRARLAGFVLNKFRGDATLLEPGPSSVTARTGMVEVGVVPMIHHQLPDEEGGTIRAVAPAGAPTVAIVRYPYASNLDEWHLLPHAAHVRWARSPADLDGADLIVLPGSKHVAADLTWLHERGLADRLRRAVGGRGRVLGVCGGAMMLGTDVADPTGVEGATRGLGMLPLRTCMAPTKLTRPTAFVVPELPGPWTPLSGRAVRGYEIRNGVIESGTCELAATMWADANVLATTVHGLFEDPEVVGAVTGVRPPPVLDLTFGQLADVVDAHLDTATLAALVEE